MTFKDYFDQACAQEIAAGIKPFFPSFRGQDFVTAVAEQVGELELKERVLLIAQELASRLPSHYPTALQIITDSLGSSIPEEGASSELAFQAMPLARFVEEFGLDYPEQSLDALRKITPHSTGEWAIRPYLQAYPELTLATVRDWVFSANHHIRRLASEGLRPRLPWASYYRPFMEDPSLLVDIISPLINDPSKYVRTSVANNLNDISKDNPQQAIETANRWLQVSDSARTLWIVKHGLRSLIKAGHPGALALCGAEPSDLLYISDLALDRSRLAIGQQAELTLVVQNDSEQERTVIVDYQVHYLRKRGQLIPKTFKLKQLTLGPGQRALLSKKHKFYPTSTRALYPGRHLLTASVNGLVSQAVEFELTPGPSHREESSLS